jgi:hypothetical protein
VPGYNGGIDGFVLRRLNVKDMPEDRQEAHSEERAPFTETQPIRPVSRRRANGGGGLHARLSGLSGAALAAIGVGAVLAAILLLIGLIALVVHRSGQTVSAVPTPTLLIEFATPVPGATRPLAVRRPPTLPAVAPTDAVTATNVSVPAGPIAPGGFVEVQGTGTLGVRLRSGPGLNYTTNRVAEEGTRFKVLEGPQSVDDFEWWRLETKDGTIGWAAATYLKPTSGFE